MCPLAPLRVRFASQNRPVCSTVCTIIGAGSLVTKSFGEGLVVAGNPARILSSIDTFKEKSKNQVFDFKGLTSSEKKTLILDNPDKWVRR